MTGIGGVTNQAGQALAQVATAPFDRAQELEADRIALERISAAGYDPRLALSAIERLRAIREKYGSEPTIVATHPQLEAREEQIHIWLEAHSGAN